MTPFDFTDRKIAVIGDVMLDAYVEGSVSRISPEAPVPVLHFRDERYVPGGAANVAANIAARVIGDRQQIVRIDREDRTPLPESIVAALIDRALEAIDWADAVILSDYGKGVFSNKILRAVLTAARDAGKRTIVDPKRADVSVYAGADFITPNRAELSLATGLPCESDAEAELAAAAMIARTGSSVILTRSAQGMSYFSADQPALHLPTFARAVFDVSGAGDTVVATLALGISSGLPVAEAMRLANHAAGVVVSKIGTAVVSAVELRQALAHDSHPAVRQKGALVPIEIAQRLRETWRAQGLTVGFTNGCFDLLHPGHISLLEQAANACDRLIVALNTDASVRRLKGETRPIQSESARARVIGALSAVDLVVLFDEDTPLEAITALLPDVLVKGSDYTPETVVGAAKVIAAGGTLVLADLVEGQSTTQLVRRAKT
jgi:D-beta-D-heptose 7-phosphate kinase/D-beta-D-heptose 1-phosphate adenosyltransferase